MNTNPISTEDPAVVESNSGEVLQQTAVAKAPAFTVKKILVPVDFSESSKKAALYAVALAAQFHASLVFIHVLIPICTIDPYAVLQGYGIEDQMRQNADERLKALIHDEIPSDISSKYLLTYGRPVTEIVDAARKEEADLIIIATRGYTGLKHALLGSTTENVIRHAPCPVLAVREKEHDFVDGETSPINELENMPG